MSLKCKATGGDARAADLNEVRRALAVLGDPEHWIQLQYAPFHAESHATFPGSDLDSQTQWVKRHEDAIGVYYALNPVPCLDHSLRVGDVLKRRWLLVDVDRDKTLFKDDSATDAEHERVRGLTYRIKDFLTTQGWPAPLVVDSGNGFQPLYRIDLPNAGGRNDLSRQLVKAVLDALAFRFASPDGSVGTECHDARRIAKLPGTWARRGTQSAERPWRMAKLLELPASVEILSPDLMRETIAKLRERASRPTPEPTPSPAPMPASDVNGQTPEELPLPKPNLVVTATDGQSIEERAIAYLATIPGGVDGQKGSCPTLWAARVVVRGYCLGVERGLQLLQAHYNQRCTPPWPEHLLRRKCEQARDVEFEKPWGWLLNEEQGGKASAGKETPPLDPKEPLTVCLGDVTPRAVDWLVPNRIPQRFITVFAGRTGIGKSFVALDLVGRLTSGGEIPCTGGQKFNPASVLLISEDSHEYVLAPRLIEAGANMKKVRAMTWKAMASYDLADASMLERACDETGSDVRLITIDPPTNFLVNADEHKNAEVRRVVMHVVDWLQERDLAVLFILHVNKNHGKGVEALNRVMGSVAWVTTSRIAHSFAPDPDDKERALFIPMKNNLGQLAKGLSYRIAKTDGLAKVEWIGEVDTTADEAMAGTSRKPRRVIASEWLVERFREKLEWTSDELKKAATNEGVSHNALFDAKSDLNLPRARRVCNENGDVGYVWWVPADWPLLSRSSANPPPVEKAGQQDSRDGTAF